MTCDTRESEADPRALAARRREVATGLSAVLASTVIFGTSPAIGSSARGGLSTLQFLTLRDTIVAILLCSAGRVVSSRPRRRPAPRPGAVASPLRGWALGALLTGPSQVLLWVSFSHISTSLAVALAGTYPLLVILLVAMRQREAPVATELAIGAITVLGVSALLVPGHQGGVTGVGVLLVFLSATIYAVNVLFAGALTVGTDALRLGGQVWVGIASLSWVLAGITGQLRLQVPPDSLAHIAIQAVLLVVATGLYYAGLRRLGASQTSLVDSAQPLVATVAGTIILKEALLPVQLGGVVIVCFAVALTSLKAGKTARAAHQVTGDVTCERR